MRRLANMRRFSERNPVTIGLIGIASIAMLVIIGMAYPRIAALVTSTTYTAYFSDVGALKPGTEVQVSGYRVGTVSAIKLDGPRVRVDFTVDDGVRLGARTEAAIRTETLLGTKVLEVIPRGDGRLNGPIPVDRTTAPYQLPDALNDLTDAVAGLDTDQLSTALATLSDTFKDTAPELRQAVDGVTRLSATINNRDEHLRRLLARANQVTGVLRERTDQVVSLIRDANALLAQLNMQSGALDQIANNISAVSVRLKNVIDDNRGQLTPTLDKLNVVLAIVDNRKERVQKAIKLLNAYAMSLGESVSSGPFFNAYVVNLLPGQFVQPFIDAAFSDLGLDPNVLLPSQLTDPQTGQKATPALPSPFPRTGQGGEPRLTVPDAITGNPGDPRYPYREPLPAPPPGGPPPGPPAPPVIPNAGATEPTGTPHVELLAPSEGTPHGPQNREDGQ
ncbi:virulence factor Mce [Mycolicibacterium phlei]|nr:mce related protein [Mycolicibacterium phlei]STZ21434.1 virulence factor Mce [Mycolicibacterium phlei]VEG11068.1 virulence factor Mce [Mycobacteroides chelonae]